MAENKLFVRIALIFLVLLIMPSVSGQASKFFSESALDYHNNCFKSNILPGADFDEADRVWWLVCDEQVFDYFYGGENSKTQQCYNSCSQGDSQCSNQCASLREQHLETGAKARDDYFFNTIAPKYEGVTKGGFTFSKKDADLLEKIGSKSELIKEDIIQLKQLGSQLGSADVSEFLSDLIFLESVDPNLAEALDLKYSEYQRKLLAQGEKGEEKKPVEIAKKSVEEGLKDAPKKAAEGEPAEEAAARKKGLELRGQLGLPKKVAAIAGARGKEAEDEIIRYRGEGLFGLTRKISEGGPLASIAEKAELDFVADEREALAHEGRELSKLTGVGEAALAQQKLKERSEQLNSRERQLEARLKSAAQKDPTAYLALSELYSAQGKRADSVNSALDYAKSLTPPQIAQIKSYLKETVAVSNNLVEQPSSENSQSVGRLGVENKRAADAVARDDPRYSNDARIISLVASAKLEENFAASLERLSVQQKKEAFERVKEEQQKGLTIALGEQKGTGIIG